jgi:gamma-glutamyltranspeptidase/glutathione hydrolase
MFEVIGDAGGVYAWPEVADAANAMGPRAVAAPRLVACLHETHLRHGRLPWPELVRPAAALAADGWELDFFSAAVIAHEMGTLPRDPAAAALYYPNGAPLRPPIGWPPEPMRNTALAEALERVAAEGPVAFEDEVLAVRGAAARGFLTRADLDAVEAQVLTDVEPLTRFRGWSIYGSPLAAGAVYGRADPRARRAGRPGARAGDPRPLPPDRARVRGGLRRPPLAARRRRSARSASASCSSRRT